jgi:hypothetical protein
MGGEVIWEALPLVLEMVEADNPESTIWQLAEIRDHFEKLRQAELEAIRKK